MDIIKNGSRYASIVWLGLDSVRVEGKCNHFSETDIIQQLAEVMISVPFKQTLWIVDDTLVPSLLLREIVDVPKSAELRDTFFAGAMVKA